ncbi:MAG: rhodanese-like domain-containing protein [Candidatus Cloacimonetes bacterium]|nr:rhodanese-like domain-containing protein [Candidatus Cloacimonadota bacterium]
MNELIIDVREEEEYIAEYIEGSILMPLSLLEKQLPILKQIQKQSITILCRSGMRAKQALEIINAHGYGDLHEYRIFEGGISRWIAEGNNIRSMSASTISVMRQVQIVVGVLLILAITASYLFNPDIRLVAGFIGGGLLFAGLSGTCTMAEILKRLPWNTTKACCIN